MITIDGRHGEGGGQILRTSLALSLVTGQPLELHHIRGRRRKSGLLRQHLTCVRAAQAIGQAKVTGAALGSHELVFEPVGCVAGRHHFAVGSAGSTSLVLQSVLPALLQTSGKSELRVEGGTHAMSAPPFSFLDASYLAVMRLMGAEVSATMARPGFFPAGGGDVRIYVEGRKLKPVHLCERADIGRVQVHAWSAGLPRRIVRAEAARVREHLGLSQDDAFAHSLRDVRGPGNVVWIEAQTTVDGHPLTAVFTGFGRRGVPAEAVADEAVAHFVAWRDGKAPVCEHLADQLLLPMALAGGGSFVTGALSSHTSTNIDTIGRFLPDVRIEVERLADGRVKVKVG